MAGGSSLTRADLHDELESVLVGPDSDGKMALKVDVTSITADTVKIDQTTPGDTNGVSIAEIGATAVASGNGVATAGTQRVAIASDNTPFAVKIDQTTPGTTNKVSIDRSTPGTTNTVAIISGQDGVAGGSGVVGNTTQRVVLATDQPALSTAGLISVKVDQTTPGTTNLVQTKETPDATSTFAITPYVSSALEASAVVKNSAGVLYGFTFTNTNVAIRYVQLFNSATVPADTAVPTLVFPVQPGSVFAFDTGKFSNYFSAGIAICNSTTLATKTLGSADSLFYVQYK